MNTIYFNLLKYVHSPFLGEEVNVGILLCFPEQGRLEFRSPANFKRLRNLYQSFSERQLITYLSSFEKRVARANAEQSPTRSAEQYTAFITRELVPADATVLRFGPLVKAVVRADDDPQQLADQYYELYFAETQPTASFQIIHSSNQYWYHLRAANGEIVQSGEGYTTKASCLNGILSVQANCQPERFNSYFASGQYGFNHVAANGEIIGRSEKYTTAQSRDHGIQIVLRNAPNAPVEYLI